MAGTAIDTATHAGPDARTRWTPSFAVDARRTLADLRRGAGDPAHLIAGDGAIWRASRMPSGAVSYRIVQATRHDISIEAWGPGAKELVAGVPGLLGAADSPETFEPRHALLAAAHRHAVGVRVPRTGRVLEALMPAVLEQKVVGLDAQAAWRRLLTWYGEPAPGPAPSRMRVPPSADTWRSIPSWDWHRAGVDPRRARVAQLCARHAATFERAAARSPGDPAEVYRLLTALPGVGRWTAAQVGHRALGDADAVPIGDYHLAKDTGWALTGAPLPEAEVEAFFEPWRPHRYRVVQLLAMMPRTRAPRRGPRMSRQDYRRL